MLLGKMPIQSVLEMASTFSGLYTLHFQQNSVGRKIVNLSDGNCGLVPFLHRN